MARHKAGSGPAGLHKGGVSYVTRVRQASARSQCKGKLTALALKTPQTGSQAPKGWRARTALPAPKCSGLNPPRFTSWAPPSTPSFTKPRSALAAKENQL